MKIIMCTDDDNGLLFNRRRQSRDGAVAGRIIEMTGGAVLRMNEYSMKMFREYSGGDELRNIAVSDDFMDAAAPGDFCFVEGVSLRRYEAVIEKIIVFRWNRKYPSDFRADILEDPSFGEKWRVESSREFAGNSHEKITEEILTRY